MLRGPNYFRRKNNLIFNPSESYEVYTNTRYVEITLVLIDTLGEFCYTYHLYTKRTEKYISLFYFVGLSIYILALLFTPLQYHVFQRIVVLTQKVGVYRVFFKNVVLRACLFSIIKAYEVRSP